MLVLSRSVDIAVSHLKIRGRHYHAYAVAGRVEHTSAYLHLLPISSRNGVITGMNLTFLYSDILTATDMDAVPSSFYSEIAESRTVETISKESIIGRTLHLKVAHLHVMTSCHQNRMRTTHVLLAKRIAHVAAVYAASTFNASAHTSYSENHSLRPLWIRSAIIIDSSLSALVARKVEVGHQRRIVGQTAGAEQYSSFVQPQRNARTQEYATCGEGSLRHLHHSTALVSTITYGCVYCFGVVHSCVIRHSTVRKDADHDC